MGFDSIDNLSFIISKLDGISCYPCLKRASEARKNENDITLWTQSIVLARVGQDGDSVDFIKSMMEDSNRGNHLLRLCISYYLLYYKNRDFLIKKIKTKILDKNFDYVLFDLLVLKGLCVEYSEIDIILHKLRIKFSDPLLDKIISSFLGTNLHKQKGHSYYYPFFPPSGKS